MVSHGGGLPGISTFSLMVPQRKAGVVVLTNRRGAKAGQIAQRLAGTLLGTPLFPVSPDSALPFRTRYPAPAKDVLSEYVGSYVFENTRIDIGAGDGALLVTAPLSEESPERVTAQAIAVSDSMFIGRREDANVMVQFVRDAPSGVSSVLSGGNQYLRV
ncbi:MAG: hypothetical protein Q8P50_16005 [Bacillota bacterium]|nr:hypothetical protein [Bacillota bacterium]